MSVGNSQLSGHISGTKTDPVLLISQVLGGTGNCMDISSFSKQIQDI